MNANDLYRNRNDDVYKIGALIWHFLVSTSIDGISVGNRYGDILGFVPRYREFNGMKNIMNIICQQCVKTIPKYTRMDDSSMIINSRINY